MEIELLHPITHGKVKYRRGVHDLPPDLANLFLGQEDEFNHKPIARIPAPAAPPVPGSTEAEAERIGRVRTPAENEADAKATAAKAAKEAEEQAARDKLQAKKAEQERRDLIERNTELEAKASVLPAKTEIEVKPSARRSAEAETAAEIEEDREDAAAGRAKKVRTARK